MYSDCYPYSEIFILINYFQNNSIFTVYGCWLLLGIDEDSEGGPAYPTG